MQETLTDTVGQFSFSNVPAGNYAFIVRSLGYRPLQDSIRVDRDIEALTFVLPAYCEFDSLVALKDIARGRVRVLLHGSPPLVDPMDPVVERRYRFQYLDFGDILTEPFECSEQYNRVVFRHFDQRFGSRWRDSVRN